MFSLLFLDYAFSQDEKAKEPVMTRLEHLLMLADWMDLPLSATFEHPVEESG